MGLVVEPLASEASVGEGLDQTVAGVARLAPATTTHYHPAFASTPPPPVPATLAAGLLKRMPQAAVIYFWSACGAPGFAVTAMRYHGELERDWDASPMGT